jgi:hypothetical protein
MKKVKDSLYDYTSSDRIKKMDSQILKNLGRDLTITQCMFVTNEEYGSF